jgi:glycosyltransferase involved in cell wall biosynthesis
MRVVFLTHNYPRWPGDVAGNFLHPLAQALLRRGHDLLVVAPSDAGQGGDDTVEGVRVRRVRYAAPERERYAYTGEMRSALRGPAGWLALRSLIRAMRRAATEALGSDRRSGVVHAHWWFPAGAALPSDAAAVVTLHGTDGQLLRKPLVPWLARRVLRPGRVVTTVSRSTARLIEQRVGRQVDDGHICPMPVPLVAAQPSRGGGGLVTLGRLTPQKRYDLALRAHRLLRDRGMDVRLTVIGDGSERATLEALSRELGTEGLVQFTGAVPPNEVRKHLADADVMLFPALQEGFGLAAVESLIAGIPVVACTDGGGAAETAGLPGAGAVVAAEPKAIADAVRALMADPAGRAAAFRVGQQQLVALSPDSVAARCESWYEEALGG